MPFDPAISLRIIHNERVRRAAHLGEYRDLGGALVVTADWPLVNMNCLEGFTTDERRVENLLDIGFSLLRAFDRPPAARITPVDRPRSLAKRLRSRGLVEAECETAMVFTGDASAIARNKDVSVRICGPDDAPVFARVQFEAGGGPSWWRGFLLASALSNVHNPNSTLYLASIDGEPAGTLWLLATDGAAGLYAVSTLKKQRRRGVASTLVSRAIADAQRSAADLITLQTDSRNDAHRLFASLGFEDAHQAVIWGERGAA